MHVPTAFIRRRSTRSSHPFFIRYIQFNAQVRNVHDHQVPWIVTDEILQPGEESHKVGVGSHIEMVDAQRFSVNGWAVRRTGTLESVYRYEQGYVLFILKGHRERAYGPRPPPGASDIYGSHHSASIVAIPIEFLRLNPYRRLRYNATYSLLGRSMGQTYDGDTIHPPRRSFTDTPFSGQTLEQKERELGRIMAFIECVEEEMDSEV